MLLFAFIVWVTTKGELPTYLAFFKPGAAAGPPTDPIKASPTTGAASPAATVAGTALAGVQQGAAIVNGAVTGGVSGAAKAVGGAIYNGVITQPLNAIQSIGKAIGLPGFK